MLINQNNAMCLVLYAHVTRSTKDFAQRKRGVWLGKWQYAKPSPKKRNLDNAIDYRLKNHLIPHEKIVEKFALEMTVSAFRKACSRAKPKESLGPTPAKAPPTSEPTAPTPHKYPRGELHDQIMAEASLQLANNWKKYGQGTRMYGPTTVIQQFTDKYPDWEGCDRKTLFDKAKKSPGQAKGVRSGVLPASQGCYLMH